MGMSKSSKLAVILAVAILSVGTPARAQTEANSETGRKAKFKVSPTYPELAKRMNIGGKVKLELVISPDGRVTSTNVIGGHPLLVQACEDAVKKWQFLPAPAQTTQIIEFEFHDH